MKHMKFIIIGTLVYLLIAAAPVFGLKLKIMTGEWFPYVSKNMVGHGFAAEVVSYAFLLGGIETEFEFAPWERCEALVKSGEAFATFPHKQTKEREKFAFFSDPIAASKSVIFFQKKQFGKFDFKNIKDLKKYKIGGVKGYYYVPLFEKAGIPVDYASDVIISFKKLYLGLIDLVPENEFVGWGIIQKFFPEAMHKFGATKRAFSEHLLRLMVSRRYPESTAQMIKFNQGLKRLQEQGIYTELLKKYMRNIDIKTPRSKY